MSDSHDKWDADFCSRIDVTSEWDADSYSSVDVTNDGFWRHQDPLADGIHRTWYPNGQLASE